MLAWLGSASVLAALAGSVWLTVDGIRSARGNGQDDLRRPMALVMGGAVAAMAVLIVALLVNDFSITYLANNHSSSTPFPFNIATAWAALEGSIVLWGLVLAGFTWVVWRHHRSSPDRLGAGALAVMGAVTVFFFGLMATVANPFEVCVEAGATRCLVSSPFPWAAGPAPVDGPGPNPLLQNHILMAVHPPLLYLGYVGLTVPYAFAISALALGRPGAEWLRRSQRWTLITWGFLTLGIVLGGWWAYEVLTWGGYWAWDPVENASLMPWLIATAFIHSALVQQRRGMLQAWNFVLVIGAFALTILGTFLTRSGTIASVHSFTQSAIGPALLGFLVVIVVGSLGLFAARAHLVAQSPRLDSLSSREGAFLLNNLLLTVYAFVVLVGTLYPLLIEAFTDEQIGVGRPFFDRIAVPLSFALLLAMGIGPTMPWRAARPGLVWRRIRGPLQVALLAGVLVVLTTSRLGYVVLAVVLGTFVIAVAVNQLWSQARRGAEGRETSIPAEAVRLVRADRGFWGGQLSHAGVALMAIAIAFAANLSVHTENVVLTEGQNARFAGYELEYLGSFTRPEPNRTVEGARVAVIRDGRQVTVLEPRLNRFPASAQAIVSPAVHTSFGGDLYLTLVGVDAESVRLDLDTSPMQWLLWVGGIVTAIGGFYAAQGRRRERAEQREVVGV